jgi:hypothetical protein
MSDFILLCSSGALQQMREGGAHVCMYVLNWEEEDGGGRDEVRIEE